jgi:hypothetical protein
VALYIDIRRVADSLTEAEYDYTGPDGELGRLLINKHDGQIELLQQAIGDDRGQYWNRAARKLVRHWADGDLPEHTCWAS